MGSSLQLNLQMVADKGTYRITAFRNSNLFQVVAMRDELTHEGGTQLIPFRVPLIEGNNTFFLRLIDLSGNVAQVTTATVAPIVRDLEFTATELRLNHLETLSSGVSLYTSDRRVNAFYTINGNASSYEVRFLVNAQIADTVVVPGPGNYSRNSLLLQTNTLNLIQLDVRSLDLNGGSGIQAESNILRIYQDLVPPIIQDLTTTFQATPPAAGVPFGPTALASFGLVLGTDTPFSTISVLNQGTGDVVTRTSGQNGRLTIAGIELPKDPSLGDAGITTTAYTVSATDAAGNLSLVRQFSVERIAIEPCFNLLRMDPFDGGRIRDFQAVSILGAVCDRAVPHTVRFHLASPTEFSNNAFFQEEQIRNLLAGELFDKDLTLPINPDQPFEDVTYSIQAFVVTTNPTNPNQQEISPAHDLGVIILDRKPPASPTVITARTLFSTNSPSFTIDGETERGGAIDFSAPGSFSFRPGRRVPAVTNEFRSVVDIASAVDGLFEIELQARDGAGNQGVNSNGSVVVKVDRKRPQVKLVRINDTIVEVSRPIFLRPAQTARIRVLLDEPMPLAPKVFVTQQGDFAVEAGLTQSLGELEFEYQFVVRQSVFGSTDGPVEVLVVGGRDNSGNAALEHREPQAFVVDTLAPVLDRALTVPRDGSIISEPPAPLRLVLKEHPNTRLPGSGPHPEKVRIRALGPLETNPTREVSGRFEVFDPRTVDFFPDRAQMNLDGTYLFELTLVDRAGNEFVETMVLELDLEKLSTTLILDRFPVPGSYFNQFTLPRLQGLPFVSIGVDPQLTPEIRLDQTQFEAFNYLKTPSRLHMGIPQVISTTGVRVLFEKDLVAGGSDDGVITVLTRLIDTAGNVSEDSVFTFVYDTLNPGIMDGLSFPVPEPFLPDDQRDPPQGAVRSGPLRSVSSILFDKRTTSAYLGSGIDTSLSSTPGVSSSTIILFLEQPLGSAPAQRIDTGRIKFRSDLTQQAPLFGGPAVSRVLFELNVDPVSLEPLGLTTDGSMDGVYRMEVRAMDLSKNASPWATNWFLYDTQPPSLSLDVNNEVWITSGVIDLRGFTRDFPVKPEVMGKFGSTKGLGVRTVAIRLESINALGSATAPPFLDWTNIPLDRNPLSHSANQEFSFQFKRTFSDYAGRVRVSLRAMDAASNVMTIYRELSLDSEVLEDPVILAPADHTATAGGILEFRWKPVAKAAAYQLIIIDEQGNRHRFAYELSQVQNPLNLDQIPKGKLRFFVQAIDGSGNTSPGDNGRTLYLDQNLPKVIRVNFESPVASNDKTGRILEYQLRTQVVFSEDLDEKVPVQAFFQPDERVQLTNSFGQTIAQTCPRIQLKSLSTAKDTWVGNLVIRPQDIFCDYNGIAYIDVEDYRDRAGNRGLPYRHSFEIDTGPWFDFRIFSNPVDEREIVFLLKGLQKRGGGLEELPEVPFFQIRQFKIPQVESEDDKMQIVNLTRLSSSTFHGTYPLNPELSGNLQLEITAADRQGNRGTRVVPFQVQQLGFDEGRAGFITTAVASLAKATTANAWVFPWHTAEDRGKGMPLFNLLPRISNHAPLELDIHLEKYPLDTSLKYAVMDCQGECKWLAQSRNQNVIRLQSTSLAGLRLIQDSKSPEIQTQQTEEELLSLEEDLRLLVRDEGSGVDQASLKVLVDQRAVDARFDKGEVIVPRSQLKRGSLNQVEVEVADNLSHKASLNLAVVTAGPIRLQEVYVVPSPARSTAIVLLRSSRTMQHLDLRIHDASGSVVAAFATFPNSSEFKIALRDILQGKSLANGVYFLRARATDTDQQSARKIQKFAWLE